MGRPWSALMTQKQTFSIHASLLGALFTPSSGVFWRCVSGEHLPMENTSCAAFGLAATEAVSQ
jgi:hypothetical protein